MLWLFRTNYKGTQCKKLLTETNLQDLRKFSSHCVTWICQEGKKWYFYLSLLNKVPRVPWVPKYPSALVPKYPSVFQVSECPSALSAWVPKCPSNARVPQVTKCPNALSARVPKCPSSPRVLWVPKCPSSPRVLWVPQVFEYLESPSASVSQLASQRVIQLVYNADSVS